MAAPDSPHSADTPFAQLPLTAQRRHSRREMRSACEGPALSQQRTRGAVFTADAQAVLAYLQFTFGDALDGLRVGVQSVPTDPAAQSQMPMYYSVDRNDRVIVLYRLPIQQVRGLHVDDEEHRRYFAEHCLFRAVCEYLDIDPWETLPGRFEHF